MFGTAKKVWQLGRMKGRVHAAVNTLREMQRAITILGQPELADNIAMEGIEHFEEHYQTYEMWIRHPHMISKEQLDQLEAMQIEMVERFKMSLEMVKSQGISYLENLEKEII